MRKFLVGFAAIALGAMVILPAGRTVADGPSQPPPQDNSRNPGPTGVSEGIDWDKARGLLLKNKAGQPLTADEQDYLTKAKQVLAQRQQRGPASQPGQLGQLKPKPTIGFTPLNQMTAKDRYKGEDGGLYGEGLNEPPKPHRAAAVAELVKVQPLDAAGKPAPAGRVVLLSMGMSNTTQEFSTFKELADADRAKSPAVTIVDGAQGGKAALQWNGGPGRAVWAEVDRRIKAAGVTAEQVQIVFIKQALIMPAQYGEFPAHARELEKQLIGNLQLARQHFANLKVAYLSSRIYGGYARGMLNPEPFAYEGGFAVRWVIGDQIKGDKELNFDPANGDVKSPVVLWGPYLWADGTTPRRSDQLTYEQADFGSDGTHPSAESGRKKVAEVMLKFFKTDPLAKCWFCAIGSGGGPPAAPAGASGSDKPAATPSPAGPVMPPL